jgi:hypothetical protein
MATLEFKAGGVVFSVPEKFTPTHCMVPVWAPEPPPATPPVPQAEVHQALVDGLANLDRYGWRQGTYVARNREGVTGLCAAGAVALDLDTPAGFELARPAVHHALAVMVKLLGGVEVQTWNDAPGRTLAEVRWLFQRAIGKTAPVGPPVNTTELTVPLEWMAEAGRVASDSEAINRGDLVYA